MVDVQRLPQHLIQRDARMAIGRQAGDFGFLRSHQRSLGRFHVADGRRAERKRLLRFFEQLLAATCANPRPANIWNAPAAARPCSWKCPPLVDSVPALHQIALPQLQLLDAVVALRHVIVDGALKQSARAAGGEVVAKHLAQCVAQSAHVIRIRRICLALINKGGVDCARESARADGREPLQAGQYAIGSSLALRSRPFRR